MSILFDTSTHHDIKAYIQVQISTHVTKIQICCFGSFLYKKKVDKDLSITRKRSSERWQPKRITAVLDPKGAHQETIHSQHDGCPGPNGQLLRGRIGHSRNLQGERDGRKGECTIYILSPSASMGNSAMKGNRDAYTWLRRSGFLVQTERRIHPRNK